LFGNVLTRRLLPVVVLACSFAVAYSTTLRGLLSVWMNDEDYSYGFLIPVISAYFVWEKRKGLNSIAVHTEWTGAPIFIILLLISAYGILGSSPSAVRPAVPLVIAATILFCFGKGLFKALLLPVMFLIFMIPLPTAVQNEISLPLKLMSTRLGAMVLASIGRLLFRSRKHH